MDLKNRKGKNFVTIMIVIAVFTLALRTAIEQTIKTSAAQNESQASVTLKSISLALENYAKDNRGVYPTSLAALTQVKPPYLSRDYMDLSPVKGYNYNCSQLDSSGYSCSAVPVKCSVTGKSNYIVTTGGLFISEKCDRRE